MTIKRLNFCLALVGIGLVFIPFGNHLADTQLTGGLQNSGWPKAGLTGFSWFRHKNVNRSITMETDLNVLQPSAYFKNSSIELTGGWRDLPSSTLFYADPRFPTGFLPPKRRSDLLFFRVFPRWFMPGAWSSRKLAGVGFYFATDSLFFSFQPKLKIWGLTIKEKYMQMDVEGERKNFQGYGRIRSWVTDDEKRSRSFVIETERRPYWDRFRYREELTEKPTVLDSEFLESLPSRESLQFSEVSERKRQYRSGLMLVDARFDSFHFMAAGMDHGDVGFRLGRLRRNVSHLDLGWYVLPELSYYQTQIYREDFLLREMRFGLGIANRRRQSSFETIVRMSDNTSVNIELNGSFRSDVNNTNQLSNLWIQPTFAFTHTNEMDSFEYMGLIEASDGQTRFMERVRYSFGLRAYSENLRIVFFYYGKKSDTGHIKDWGYLRLEFQQNF